MAHFYLDSRNLSTYVDIEERLVADSLRVLGADHKDTVFFRTNLVTAYEAVKRYEEAEALRKQGIIENDSDIADDDPVRVSLLCQLAEKFMENKEFDNAISTYEMAISESTRIFGAEHKTTFIMRYNHAITYAAIEQIDKSIALLKQLKRS